MLVSTLTSKGQTTIPKEIRKFLHLSAEDKILYVPDPQKNQVILTSVTGTILGLRGVVPYDKGQIDFNKLRDRTKKDIGLRRTDK